MSIFSTTNCQIWMGSLEPYMSENFIMTAFRQLGEHPLRVKIMRDKNTGDAAGYCFVHFESEDKARTVLHKLNGKMIPNTSPSVRFKLNYAGPNKQAPATDEFSLFVGDLSSDVDDFMLFKCLSSRYPSVRTAKVVLDNSGVSKGYAFVRFALESDQKKCTAEMNGFVGLGSKPMKIGSAIPREQKWKKPDNNSSATSSSSSNTVVPTYDYAQSYYDPAAWQGYSWTANSYHYYQQQAMAYSSFYNPGPSYEGLDDMALIDHTAASNVDEMNQAVLNRDMDFWDSIEASKWSPLEVSA